MPWNKNLRIQSTFDALRKPELILFALAAALLWSWLDLGTYSTFLFKGDAAHSNLAESSALMTSAVSALPLLAGVLSSRDVRTTMARPAVMAAAGVAGCFGTLGIAAGTALGSGELVFAASLLQGCAIGLFSLMVVVAALAARSAIAMGMLVAGSVVLGMAIDALLLALQQAFLIGAIAFLPVACAIISARALVRVKAAPESQSPASPHPTFAKPVRSHASLLAFIAAFSFMYGYLQYFSTTSHMWMDPDGTPLLVARCVAMIAVFALLCGRRVRLDIVLRAAIIVSLIGFSLISDSFFLHELRTSGVVTSAAGYACFDVVTWSLLAEVACYLPRYGARLATLGVFVWQAGTCAGLGIGLASEAAQAPDAAIGLIASIVTICIVAVGVNFMGSELWSAVRRGSSPYATDKSEPNAVSFVDEAAKRYLLTNREAEILAYLLKGRTIPYIAEAECISENTVRSHAKNIYAKMDVHTRQELIDMVEGKPI